MSQTISVSTTMGEQGFRDFAVFDAFHHRKAWLRPAVFAAIMLGFCRRLPFAAGQALGCRAAGCCACHCGHRPAGELLLLVLPQRFPADQTDAPAACLLPCGAGRHRHCCVDVRPAGQARTHQPPRMGQLLLRLPHGQCGVPLRRKRESLLTDDRMEVVWKFLASILPKEKLHDCRKG